MDNQRRFLFFATALAGLAPLAALGGCGSRDEITVVTVPKPHVVEKLIDSKFPRQSQDRMLAAVVPGEDETGWYFKVVGAKDSVADIEPQFRTLLESIRFEDGIPTWDLPDGWKQRAGQGIAKFSMTIPVDGGSELEMTVTDLPLPEADRDQFTLSNINRWRGQMGLAPIDLASMKASTEQLQADGRTVTFVSLAGEFGSRPRRGMPAMGDSDLSDIHAGVPGFESGGRPRGGTGGDAGGPKGFDENLLALDAPESWQAAPLSSIRKASYRVTDGDRKLEISISSVGGSQLDNLNRWRDQVGLAPIAESELDTITEPIEIDGWTGRYMEFFSPDDAAEQQANLGVILEADGRPWFIKANGDAKLARREIERFKNFAESVRFKNLISGN